MPYLFFIFISFKYMIVMNYCCGMKVLGALGALIVEWWIAVDYYGMILCINHFEVFDKNITKYILDHFTDQHLAFTDM